MILHDWTVLLMSVGLTHAAVSANGSARGWAQLGSWICWASLSLQDISCQVPLWHSLSGQHPKRVKMVSSCQHFLRILLVSSYKRGGEKDFASWWKER